MANHLRVLEAKFISELLAVRFADVLLLLEGLLQALALGIGEHGSPQHTSSGLTSQVVEEGHGTGQMTSYTCDTHVRCSHDDTTRLTIIDLGLNFKL